MHTDNLCQFNGCDRSHYGGGLCQGHYQQRRRGTGLKPLRGTNRTPDERFFAVIAQEGTCWRWMGATAGGGYGVFRIKGRNVPSHRWVYEYLRADIPDGLDLDHLCRNRWCVNAWHLEPVTRRINTSRGALFRQPQFLLPPGA